MNEGLSSKSDIDISILYGSDLIQRGEFEKLTDDSDVPIDWKGSTSPIDCGINQINGYEFE